MIIDTHCHLDFSQFDRDRDAVIERANSAGVRYFINIGSSLEGSKKSLEIACAHEGIFASVGIHPHYADEATEQIIAELERIAKHKKVVAIGEVGLDYYKSPCSPEKQKALFKKFIEYAHKLTLPLIIHNREANTDILEILETACNPPIMGVMHCFSQDKGFLEDVLGLGLFVSFTCNVTFENAASLRNVVRSVPLDRLLLETDAPFLAPQRKRGQRNEPAYITELRDVMSDILGVSKNRIEDVTTSNAKRLFGIDI